ncbi:hypothetical protein ACOBV9_21060 (plasmid) [Pseudoalteromonas espejiana]
MDEPISKQLLRLMHNTNQILKVYNDKEQWQHLYPLVVHTAQQYRETHKQHRTQCKARMSLYMSQYDFATNLVINQCVLSAAVCSSQHYDEEPTELYISIRY